MTPEELNKNAKLSQDALDRANLKLALMRFNADKAKDKKMFKTPAEHEEEKTFVATVSCVLDLVLVCSAEQ